VSLCRNHRTAWDCGTGTGQAAVRLADRFSTVEATDVSPDQLAHAEPRANVRYRVAAAESSGLEAASVDLVTVAQALHWFPTGRFWTEVRRVVREDGVIAAWCYTFPTVDDRIDPVFERFHRVTLGRFWPAPRRQVDREYRDLPFPFREIDAPRFHMRERWTLDRFLGYIGTWSAVGIYRKCNRADPVALVREDLERRWGAPETIRELVWPIHLRVGRR
jgi:SAM-dependent methyltransferase